VYRDAEDFIPRFQQHFAGSEAAIKLIAYGFYFVSENDFVREARFDHSMNKITHSAGVHWVRQGGAQCLSETMIRANSTDIGPVNEKTHHATLFDKYYIEDGCKF
jgi:hypothetical protein